MNPKIVLDSATEMSDVLNSTIDNNQARLAKSIKNLEKRIMAQMRELKTNAQGELMGPRVNLKQAQVVHKKIVATFEEEYGTGIYSATKGFDVVSEAIKNTWPDLDDAMSFTGFDRDMMQVLQNQAFDEFKQFGTGIQDKMSDALYSHVIAGTPYSELVNTIGTLLGTAKDTKGYSMARYADQWANDSIMNFHQQVTLKKANDAGLKSFLYYGNIITTSRNFCIDRVGKVYTRKEIDSWNEITWQGKSGPPMTYRGGYNCRHHWHPVKKEWVPDGSIEVQDWFDEKGIKVVRGNTIPSWPGVKKASKPKPRKERPKDKAANYVDPHNRWVPYDLQDKSTKAWTEQVFKEGEIYSKWSGTGPCAPVADNLVEVLRAQGHDARVMFSQYLPKGGTSYEDAFGHYTAVILDKKGKVTRIYDPINPHAPGNKIINIDAKKPLPREYWPRTGNEFDKTRIKTNIFNVGEWARDDGMLYTMDDHRWWYGKLSKPKVGKPGVPKTTQRVLWRNVDDRVAGKKQMRRLLKPVTEKDYYPICTWGNNKGSYRWRFNQAYAGLKRDADFKTLDKHLHGEFLVGLDVTSDAINAVGSRVADFQNRCGNSGLPYLRCVNYTKTVARKTTAAMGDGVLHLNLNTINKYLADYVLDIDKYKKELNIFIEVATEAMEATGIAEGKRSKAYLVLKEQIKLRQDELDRIKNGTFKTPKFGQQHTKASTYIPGKSDVIGEPALANRYYSNDVDKAYVAMEHEFGHHIHQQIFTDRDNLKYMSPPMEDWLDYWFMKLRVRDKTNNKIISTYARQEPQEWFAENYAAWRMDKKGYVQEELWGLMETLDDLMAGKITQKQLANKMWDDTTNYLDPILPATKNKYEITKPLL